MSLLDHWPQSLAQGQTVASFTFIGGKGHHAHLHYDGDFRNVLLIQVFGTKQAVLIPPTHPALVNPIGNFSGAFLNRMTAEQRSAFMTLSGAQLATLRAGDALFMPAAIWHFLDYQDNGMSINLRFAPSKTNARLAGLMHAHGALQFLAWHFADGHVPDAAEVAAVDEMVTLARTPSADTTRRGLEIEALTSKLAGVLCPPHGTGAFLDGADTLRMAYLRYESERLYPYPRAPMYDPLTGWPNEIVDASRS
jgi:hypothetical protein